jgi:hypothetical protein
MTRRPSQYEAQGVGCPKCGALPKTPCVRVHLGELRKLIPSRQYRIGGPLPEIEHMHADRYARFLEINQTRAKSSLALAANGI